MRRLIAILFLIPALAAAMPKVVERVSPAGIHYWQVEEHTLPLISMNFAFTGGSAADTDAEAGITGFATSLLDQGAGDMDAQKFQERLEEQAVKLGFSSGEDAVTGSLRTLTDRRDEAFSLLSLALKSPRFDAGMIELRRRQYLAALKAREENAGARASLAFQATLYKGHPYGRDDAGTPETLKGFDTSRLKSWVKRRFARSNLLIGIVGDASEAEAGRLIDLAFADLPARADMVEAAKTVPQAQARIDFQHVAQPQTVILFGLPGISNQHPDWYAFRIANEILGGGMDSRLFKEIREKKGLTYGVNTNLANSRAADLFTGGLSTRNEKAAEAIAAVKEVMSDFVKNGVTEKERADTVSYLTGSYALSLDSSAKMAGQMVGVQLSGLPLSYFEDRNKRFKAVTLDEVNRAIRDHLPVHKLYFSTAGGAEGLETQGNGGQD